MSRFTLGALSGVAAAALVAALLLASDADADKTICATETTANAVVDEMKFTSLADAGVSFVVCAHTKYTDGGVTPGICSAPADLPTGQIKTDVVNLRQNRALPFIVTNQGW